MDENTVVEKIRKLLALAESDNEHEAALAAQRAQELMLKHHVDAARVKDASVKVEPISQERAIRYGDEESGRSSRIPLWHLRLIRGLARNMCCDYYYTPGRSIWLVGRESDRQVVKFMFDYLRREIDRLADLAWNKPGTQSWGQTAQQWKRGFRIGAALEVGNRLYRAQHPEPLRPGKQLPAAPVTETALVLRSRVAEVDAWVKDNLKLSRGSASAASVNPGGFNAGRQAGRSINLSGGGKGLPSAAKRLTGGAP